jgi:hypothetical protein
MIDRKENRMKRTVSVLTAVLVACGAWTATMPPGAAGAVASSDSPATHASVAEGHASSLESAAAKAGNTGRAVAMSLIGLAFAVAATVLAFRRDFREAAGVFAVGIVAVLLATPTGVTLMRDTVASLFGSQ